ncbi:neural cell adhesion molecule 1-like isoform X3 [Alosa sapidissima]|uniref:neural cell adhesion molecule 1-like isoform X3 n=1 Tax=Alosa sapidissima TaxID=34773 RepID=UPI001C09FCED|nr:neural cell adhesion molecule 1-like isoform X3 [Alosa sapidissima]
MLQTRDLVWALLFFGYAASLQVEITPNMGEISVGESKFFFCEVVGDAKEISWFAPSGEKILPDRTDISISAGDETSSTLTIYNANVDNAGIYKCVAKNGDQESQASVVVKIFQRITFENAPSPQEFNEGDDADIVCDVVSSPPPTIIWKYQNQRIQLDKDVRFRILSNNHLQIRGIKKTDEGAYTCEARIMARGEVDLRVIKAVINVLPSIRTRQTELNATADIGQSITLACDADGFPEPAVTWARDGVVLEENDKYAFKDDGSELVIHDVKKVDEGEYSCIATNKAGRKEEEVSLNVFVQPKITFLENQTASELDEQITLTCEATGDPTPTIVWSFGRRVFNEDEQSLDGNVVVRSDARVSSLTLKFVQFTDAGQYLCTARNDIGIDHQNMYLEVRYAPKIQGPVTVYTWEGNAANISCEVLAHPVASVVWYRDGQQLPSTNTTNVKIYNTPAVSYLELTPDSQNDFGSYNCTASNVMGTESKEFLLIQAEVPSVPSIERVEPYSSTALVEFDEPMSDGGVPVLRYKVEWRAGGADWTDQEYSAEYGLNGITITGLKPETVYELRLSAINGKGQGESSPVETFKTQPVQGEPNPPKLEGKLQTKGNSLKVSWMKQDDGGSPIMHYLVHYKIKQSNDWRPEIRMPASSDYVLLNGLDWNKDYEVHVVAENQQGKSQPSVLSIRTSPEPTAIPGMLSEGAGLGTGAIVGILVVVFLLLLAGVDVTCYFLNKCGLLMCIAVNFCGKAGPGAKAKEAEEGKAAFTKDESKEPIVEVRTEDERTPNHEGGSGPLEPNETTPLTDPEHAADSMATVVDLLPSASSIPADPAPASDCTSPASDCTPLTSVSDAPKASPKTAPKDNPKTDQTAVAPLVDLSDTPTPAAGSAPNATAAPKAPSASPSPSPSQATANEAPGGGAGVAESAQSAPSSTEPQVDVAPAPPSTEPTRGSPTSTAPPSGGLNDGKIVTEDKSKADEKTADPKATSPSEVKAVPNEAPQSNGNESKA